MTTIEDITKDEESSIDGDIRPENIPINEDTAGGNTPQGIDAGEMSQKIIEILKKPTGEGEISDYVEHPLNFEKSESLAQILRGLTGFFGDLKLAVIDVGIGVYRKIKSR